MMLLSCLAHTNLATCSSLYRLHKLDCLRGTCAADWLSLATKATIFSPLYDLTQAVLANEGETYTHMSFPCLNTELISI